MNDWQKEHFSQDYWNYIHSPEWKARRVIAIKKAHGRCQECGTKKCLQVHHISYQNLFHERDEDLRVLCKYCHDERHGFKSRRKPKSWWRKALGI